MNVVVNSVWPEAAKELTAHHKDHSKDKDAGACKARFAELKKMYRAFKRLNNMGGGGWDQRSKRVGFEPAWWDDWAPEAGKKNGRCSCVYKVYRFSTLRRYVSFGRKG